MPFLNWVSNWFKRETDHQIIRIVTTKPVADLIQHRKPEDIIKAMQDAEKYQALRTLNPGLKDSDINLAVANVNSLVENHPGLTVEKIFEKPLIQKTDPGPLTTIGTSAAGSIIGSMGNDAVKEISPHAKRAVFDFIGPIIQGVNLPSKGGDPFDGFCP